MKILAVIPSRFASTRFPGKPLIDIKGKTMIQRVFEQAKQCKSFADVIVATDDERIYNHVIEFGGKAMMTSEKHPSGTDRCAEVLSKIDQKYDAVVNVQGDEPFVKKEPLQKVIDVFSDATVQVASLMQVLSNPQLIEDPNYVKVAVDIHNNALFFSRSVIPYPRDKEAAAKYYEHIGVYAFKKQTLLDFTNWPMSPLEAAEKIECLRYLENGVAIKMVVTEYMGVEIDTPEDLMKAAALLK